MKKQISTKSAPIIVYIGLVCILPAVTRAASVTVLLPAGKDVSGWSVYSGTLVYCPKPDTLTEIYDGGLDLYTRNGVVEAASQIYKGCGTTAELVIHRMKTERQAKSFQKYWATQVGAKNLLGRPVIKDEAFLATEGRTTAGYLRRGSYFVTVKVNTTGKTAQIAATGFLKAVSSKLGK